MKNQILSFKKIRAMEEIRESLKNFDRTLFDLLLSQQTNVTSVLFLHRLYFSSYCLSETKKIMKIYQILKICQILVEGAVTIKR